MANAQALFRLILQVDDLDKASEFYAKLLDDPEEEFRRASRHYIDCGPVILALVDVTAGGEEAKPTPDYIYFAVGDLERFHARATELDCLSTEDVHGVTAPARWSFGPWGERSFYATRSLGQRTSLC